MFTWKILDVFAEDNVITVVKYHVSTKNNKNKVETIGNWTFNNKTHFLQDQTVEKDVIAWIQAESIINEKCIIEDNLIKQLTALEPTVLKKPWILPTFTVKI
jgi:hypothetical protein